MEAVIDFILQLQATIAQLVECKAGRHWETIQVKSWAGVVAIVMFLETD